MTRPRVHFDVWIRCAVPGCRNGVTWWCDEPRPGKGAKCEGCLAGEKMQEFAAKRFRDQFEELVMSGAIEVAKKP